ncbi:MAG: purine phosphorylase [Defluviicoccus sp.]|nr:MAG: purine phosphorylase [Defluviicoccus sp.]
MRLGIVSGLASEAACLRVFDVESRLRVRCAGAGPTAARSAASTLLAEGCTALVSFGCAGGLDPRLGPGTVMVATEIVDRQGGRFPTDRSWCARVLTALGDSVGEAFAGRLLGNDSMLASAAEKQRLASELAASLVDMESHAIARVAAEAGVPMLAIRVVCDQATTSLPVWLDGVVGEDGKPRTGQVVARLAAHPSDLGRVLKLAANQRAALKTLRRVALRVGPLFALG